MRGHRASRTVERVQFTVSTACDRGSSTVAGSCQENGSSPTSTGTTKAELLVLLSHTTIPRLAGWDSAQGLDEALASSVTEFFGTPAWRRIHEKRTTGLSAAEARHLYTTLFRYRLQETLGYATTLTIEMGNECGAPVYVLVFATDHPAGTRIMSSVLEEAREQSAEYRSEVAQRRSREERERAGTPNLFDAMGQSPAEPPLYFETTQGDESPTLPGWLMDDSSRNHILERHLACGLKIRKLSAIL